jgi:hypothetical protein
VAMPREWVRRIVAQVSRPGTTLFVRFDTLDGYDWDVTPVDRDPCSMAIAHAFTEALRSTLEELDSLACVALLDRLYCASPVSVRVRPSRDQPPLKSLSLEVSLLLARFIRSRPEARLLTIPESSLTMDFTLRQSFDPASTVETWPRSDMPTSRELECPVCDASPEQIHAAYPGTQGCAHCGAIFVCPPTDARTPQ